MKILVVKADFYMYGDSLAKAFSKLGYEVDVFSHSSKDKYQILSRASRLFWLISNAATHSDSLFSRPSILEKANNEELLKKIDQFNPDILVAHPGYFISKKTLKAINCKKIIWIYDSIYRMPKLQKVIGLYDKVFFFEGTDKNYFIEKRIDGTFLPLCLEPAVYHPINQEKDIDICFIGNMSDERIGFLVRLKEKFPDLVIRVFGKIPKKYLVDGEHRRIIAKYDTMFANANLLPSEVNSIYARSKICLNVHHNQSKSGVNARFFEIMGSNNFQIVDWNEYIGREFRGCVATFKTFEELCEKISYYLMHEDERIAISKKGYDVTVSNHCFENRAVEISKCFMDS